MVLGIVRRRELFRVEGGAILSQTPRGHILWDARANGNDYVRERGPRMIQVELRRTRRVVGMRMIEPEEVGTRRTGVLLGFPIIRGADLKTAARPEIGGVRQREGGRHET